LSQIGEYIREPSSPGCKQQASSHKLQAASRKLQIPNSSIRTFSNQSQFTPNVEIFAFCLANEASAK